jgi:hypothetical protein
MGMVKGREKLEIGQYIRQEQGTFLSNLVDSAEKSVSVREQELESQAKPLEVM